MQTIGIYFWNINLYLWACEATVESFRRPWKEWGLGTVGLEDSERC